MCTSRCESVGLWIVGVAVCAAGLVGEAGAQSLPSTIASKVQIVDPEGPFPPGVMVGWEWGKGVASMGDIDRDGWADLATMPGGFEGGGDGWVRLLHLKANGTIDTFSKFFTGVGGDDPVLQGYGYGPRLAALGDLNGDGNADLAASSIDVPVRILFLDGAGGVVSMIDPGPPLPPVQAAIDWYGASLAAPGDLDADGVVDLVVGAPGDDLGGTDSGSAWVLLMNPDGSLKGPRLITEGEGGFTGLLGAGDQFGSAVGGLGDLNGDGWIDLGVGALGTDAGGALRGALWVLFMGPNAVVLDQVQVTMGEGGFTGTLRNADRFGAAVAGIPDLDGDGRGEVAVGAPGDDGNNPGPIEENYGAVWILDLESDGTVQQHVKFAQNSGLGLGMLEVGSRFGTEFAPYSVPDGGACGGLLVSEPGADEWAQDAGNLWALLLHAGEWTNLGGSLAGSSGVPNLTQAGVQCQGNPLQLMLQTGQPGGTLVVMFIGFTQANLPFKGGTLVPFPHLFFALTTGGGGNITLTGLWPAGVPSGLTTIFQAWVHDSGAPFGLSASDALMGTAP